MQAPAGCLALESKAWIASCDHSGVKWAWYVGHEVAVTFFTQNILLNRKRSARRQVITGTCFSISENETVRAWCVAQAPRLLAIMKTLSCLSTTAKLAMPLCTTTHLNLVHGVFSELSGHLGMPVSNTLPRTKYMQHACNVDVCSCAMPTVKSLRTVCCCTQHPVQYWH